MYNNDKNSMIKFERIYNYNGNDYRILIDRMWPRGIKKDRIDLWYKEIAPSKELVKEYHQTNEFENFKEKYIKELYANGTIVNELIKIIKSKPCVLLYSSKKEENNSTILKEYLEQKLK